MDMRAGVDSNGQIVAWDSEIWSLTKGNRPNANTPGNIITGALVGFPVHREGTIMGSNAFEVDVAPACSGAVPTSIYLAAVYAYPTSWRARNAPALPRARSP